jgi:hypothetical protein
MLRKLVLFPSWGEGRKTPTLLDLLDRAVQWVRLALSMGPNSLGVFLLSPEDGNRFSFWNVVFSSYLEFMTMDRVHKHSDSDCCAPLSELLTFNINPVGTQIARNRKERKSFATESSQCRVYRISSVGVWYLRVVVMLLMTHSWLTVWMRLWSAIWLMVGWLLILQRKLPYVPRFLL